MSLYKVISAKGKVLFISTTLKEVMAFCQSCQYSKIIKEHIA